MAGCVADLNHKAALTAFRKHYDENTLGYYGCVEHHHSRVKHSDSVLYVPIVESNDDVSDDAQYHANRVFDALNTLERIDGIHIFKDDENLNKAAQEIQDAIEESQETLTLNQIAKAVKS